MKKLVFLMMCCIYPASAGLIVIGQPADSGTGNCFPLGCAYNAEYQQVYSSGQFGGPVSITGLEFFNTQFEGTASSTPTGNIIISLSTASVDPSTITGDFSANEGADMLQVFNGSISPPWAFGDTLTITFSTPFSYDPSGGNLLLDVVGSTSSSAGIYFDINSSGSNLLSRVYCSGGSACGNSGSTDLNYGLVTGFLTDAGEVPEPATISMAALGLIATLALRRRFASPSI